MTDKKKINQINKYAILVHQLPLEDENVALSYFSGKSIRKVSYGLGGLQISFKDYDPVFKSILREKIEVKGIFYKIYPMVTNLTICGIGPYVTDSIVNEIMQPYGFVIDSYRVQETIDCNKCKTVSLTNDYRVILGIPEIFANFHLIPVRLPDMTHKYFEVTYFCRLCRRNGHMQFQCTNVRKSSSFAYHQNMDAFRRTSFESDSSDMPYQDRTNCHQSDFYADLQNSNTLSDSRMKRETEQNYISDQNCHTENEHYSNKDNSSRCFAKSTWRKIDDKEFEGKNTSASMELTSKISNRKMFVEKRKCNPQYGNDETRRESQASNSGEYSNKIKKKKNFQLLLSSLIPPNMNLFETIKLFENAAKSNFEDISAEFGSVMMHILNYNRERRTKHVHKGARDFLICIKMVLCKLKRTQWQNEISNNKLINNHIKEPDHVKGNDEARKEIQASNSSEYSNKIKKKKKQFRVILSSLIPPNMNFVETKKLFENAVKSNFEDISAEFESVLLHILNYNRKRKKKYVDERARHLLKFIKMVLSKMERNQSEKSNQELINNHLKEPELVKDEKPNSEISKEITPRKRNVTLSLGIKNAISMTTGELQPEFLCNFLNHARRRKNLLEVASAFTQNIPALASQLLEVQKMYYRHVEKRGPEEDRDISYIKRLSQRLENSIGNTTNVFSKKEADITKVSVKSETDMTKVSTETVLGMTGISVKKEPVMTELPVKPEAEIFMRQTNEEGDFTDKKLLESTSSTRMPSCYGFIKTEVNDMD